MDATVNDFPEFSSFMSACDEKARFKICPGFQANLSNL